MRVEIVDTLAEVEPLRDAWNAMAGDQLLLSWDWLISWWEAFGSGHRLAIVTAMDDQGQLLGLAPWFVEQSLLGPKVRCLGSGKACTDYMSIIALPGRSAEVVNQITQFTIRAIAGKTEFRLGGAHSLELEGVEPNSDWLSNLSASMKRAGYVLERQTIENSWQVPLSDDWDALLAKMKGSFRRKARKAMRRLEDKTVSFHTSDDTNFWPMFDTFVELHQMRRVMMGESGCFSDPRFHAFLKMASQRLLPRHAVRLQWIELVDQPIAIQFQLVTNHTVSMYQSGMDPAHRKMEPGHTMVAAVLSDALQMGHQCYDFLRGDEPYKRDWTAEPVALERWRFVSPSFSARFREGYTSAARQVRDAARKVISNVGKSKN